MSQPWLHEFPEPQSVAEAQQRMRALQVEIETIQAQLGTRNRTDHAGDRLPAQQYWAWRDRAKKTLNKKQQRYRTLKGWCRDRCTVARDGNRDGKAAALLARCHRLLDRLIDLDEAAPYISEDDRLLVQEAAAYLHRTQKTTR